MRNGIRIDHAIKVWKLFSVKKKKKENKMNTKCPRAQSYCDKILFKEVSCITFTKGVDLKGCSCFPFITKFIQFRGTLPGCPHQPAKKILDLSFPFSWLCPYSGPQRVKKYPSTHHKPGHRPVLLVSPGAYTRRDAVSHHL